MTKKSTTISLAALILINSCIATRPWVNGDSQERYIEGKPFYSTEVTTVGKAVPVLSWIGAALAVLIVLPSGLGLGLGALAGMTTWGITKKQIEKKEGRKETVSREGIARWKDKFNRHHRDSRIDQVFCSVPNKPDYYYMRKVRYTYNNTDKENFLPKPGYDSTIQICKNYPIFGINQGTLKYRVKGRPGNEPGTRTVDGQIYLAGDECPTGVFIGAIDNNGATNWGHLQYRIKGVSEPINIRAPFDGYSIRGYPGIYNYLTKAVLFNTNILKKLNIRDKSLSIYDFVARPDPIDPMLAYTFFASVGLYVVNATGSTGTVKATMECNSFSPLDADVKVNYDPFQVYVLGKNQEVSSSDYMYWVLRGLGGIDLASNTPFLEQLGNKIVNKGEDKILHDHLKVNSREVSWKSLPCESKYKEVRSAYQPNPNEERKETVFDGNTYTYGKEIILTFYTRQKKSDDWKETERHSVFQEPDCDDLTFLTEAKHTYYLNEDKTPYNNASDPIDMVIKEMVKKYPSIPYDNTVSREEAKESKEVGIYHSLIVIPKRDSLLKRYTRSYWYIPKSANSFTGVWHNLATSQLFLISMEEQKGFELSTDITRLEKGEDVVASRLAFGVSAQSSEITMDYKERVFSLKINKMSSSRIEFTDGSIWLRQ